MRPTTIAMLPVLVVTVLLIGSCGQNERDCPSNFTNTRSVASGPVTFVEPNEAIVAPWPAVLLPRREYDALTEIEAFWIAAGRPRP